jgi:uncharacterized protein YggU (UPF0235/DUF167 family)
MDWFRLDEKRDTLILKLHVQPNARSTGVSGLHAPAVDDKANKLLIDFIGRMLDLPANRVIIASGLHTRKKIVQIVHPEPSVITRVRELVP